MFERLSSALRRQFFFSRRRFFFGALIVALFLLFLPHDFPRRLWWGSVLLVFAPLLTLGRSQRWAREGMSETLESTPSPIAWQLLQLRPALLIVILAGLVIGRGAIFVALIFTLWGFTAVTLADTLDRRLKSFGHAWCWSTIILLTYLSAPFWGGIWFGRSSLSPWLATLCVNLNPAVAGLAAAGRSTLQDAILYRLTLSGVVEVRPLPWWWCAVMLATITLFTLLFNLFAEQSYRHSEQR